MIQQLSTEIDLRYQKCKSANTPLEAICRIQFESRHTLPSASQVYISSKIMDSNSFNCHQNSLPSNTCRKYQSIRPEIKDPRGKATHTTNMCHRELQVHICLYCGAKQRANVQVVFCPDNPYHDPHSVQHCGDWDKGRVRERIIRMICARCERYAEHLYLIYNTLLTVAGNMVPLSLQVGDESRVRLG
jgi:hypothetical protein